jgi:hypothetical protein
MTDMFDKVTSQQDIIKKILSKLPGFSGYIERENRRSSDKVIRDTIAKRFEVIWSRISSLQKDLIRDGDLKSVGDLEAAAIKLRQFIDRIQKASYGYSGFFDAVKINEKELGLIYQYDLAMLDLADQVDKAADNVETSIGTDGLKAAIRNLVNLSDQCVQTYDKRGDVITGMNSTQQ